MIFTQPDLSLPEKSSNHSGLTIPLYDSSLYLNREFPWLSFNSRVHKEVHDKTAHLSRKFDCADTSNPDRFFMIHLDSLVQTLNADINDCDPSGQTVYGQLDIVSDKAGNPFTEQYCCFTYKVLLAAPEPGEKVL